MENFDKDQLEHMLKSYCPSVVFPYLREAVSDVTSRGGYAPLYLNPVNFDAIYAQNKAKEEDNKKKTNNTEDE